MRTPGRAAAPLVSTCDSLCFGPRALPMGVDQGNQGSGAWRFVIYVLMFLAWAVCYLVRTNISNAFTVMCDGLVRAHVSLSSLPPRRLRTALAHVCTHGRTRGLPPPLAQRQRGRPRTPGPSPKLVAPAAGRGRSVRLRMEQEHGD